RNVFKTAASIHVETGLVGALDRAGVAQGAARGVVEVLVDAADTLVEVEKLRRGDRSRVQRAETILDANIVEGPQAKSGNSVAPVNVSHPVEHRRPGAALIGHWVIA